MYKEKMLGMLQVFPGQRLAYRRYITIIYNNNIYYLLCLISHFQLSR